MGKTIGIISLKGGVGKTSVVGALGYALSDFDKKVLLIDGNLSAPNLGLHLNIINPKITLHNILNRSANARDAICKLDNFDIIPSSLSSNLRINPLKLKDRIKFLKRDYDIILMDSSPALNEETLAVMLASDRLLVVTTPDHPTLSTTIKSVKLAKKRGVPIDGLILNKVHDKNFEISVGEIERITDVPVMAIIPYDINALKAVSNLVPFTQYKSKSKGSIEYKKLAATLIGEKYNPFSFKNLFKNPSRQEINREIYYERFFK
ncbi:hypothetical protein DRN69_03650 [Candidatus Pacearchaeota archaeon]|nr:MAG: hypothetical protein DRN69_03650 [Candidatus Pacearchaeota archaeon]